MAYTPKTNWQKGEVLEAADMNRVESGLSDVYTRLDTAATMSITLKAGLQTITSDRDKPFNLTSIRGRLLLNLLGRAGNFETLTGWIAAGTTIALNTANALYGSNCVQITLGSTTGRVSRAINTVSGRTYVVAVEARIGTAANARVDVTGQGNGNAITSTNGYQISYMRFTANAATHTVGITVTGANGQTAFADGFRVYEVSPTEYTAFTTVTADTVAVKYPYTEGLAGAKNPYVIRWTDSSKSQLAAMLAFDTEILANPSTDADAETDTLYVRADGTYYKTSIWRKLTLGGDLLWTFKSSSTGIKRVQISGLGTSVATTPQGYLIKYDGQIGRSDLGAIANWTAGDIWQLGDEGYNNFYLSVSSSDSGWGDNYNPSDPEIRAYFYGWRMYNADAATEGTIPYNGTGTKAWGYRVGGGSNNLTGGTTVLPTILAPNFTPYELMYKRASSITEPVASEGALSLVSGDNVIEMGSGLIIRESARPQSTSLYYWINGATTISSATRNRVRSFLQIYKDGRPDQWAYLGTGGFIDQLGLQQAQLPIDRFDSSSSYSVSYLTMQYYPIPSIVGSTANNERSILDDLTRDIQQLTDRVSVTEMRKIEKESTSQWITPTLLNGWTNYNVDFSAIGYHKDTLGYIHLKGVVAAGGGNAAIFKLPAGYRPSKTQPHIIAVNTNGTTDATGRININPNGDVVYLLTNISPTIGNGGWVSLANIPPFLGEQ